MCQDSLSPLLIYMVSPDMPIILIHCFIVSCGGATSIYKSLFGVAVAVIIVILSTLSVSLMPCNGYIQRCLISGRPPIGHGLGDSMTLACYEVFSNRLFWKEFNSQIILASCSFNLKLISWRFFSFYLFSFRHSLRSVTSCCWHSTRVSSFNWHSLCSFLG